MMNSESSFKIPATVTAIAKALPTKISKASSGNYIFDYGGTKIGLVKASSKKTSAGKIFR